MLPNKIIDQLNKEKLNWLVTGGAGFIGSHIVETLISHKQNVKVLDNLSTGFENNIRQFKGNLNFQFVKGDICDQSLVNQISKNIDIVLHQAAVGSVPRSMADPIKSLKSNLLGLLSVLKAAEENDVKRVVYSSSSSIFGDGSKEAQVLSPYAFSKKNNEEQAEIFAQNSKLEVIGLRYFNVFGTRQNPNGAYAAVIPKWIESFKSGSIPEIYGDGSTSRDFCYIENVIYANLLAAFSENSSINGKVYSISCGEETSLLELYDTLQKLVENKVTSLKTRKPIFKDFRSGDIKHSLADISDASEDLGYQPLVFLYQGLEKVVEEIFD